MELPEPSAAIQTNSRVRTQQALKERAVLMGVVLSNECPVDWRPDQVPQTGQNPAQVRPSRP